MTNNLLGLKTVPLPTYADDGFMPSPNQAATLITVRTKAIVLVTPNNPVCSFLTVDLLALIYPAADWCGLLPPASRIFRCASARSTDCANTR